MERQYDMGCRLDSIQMKTLVISACLFLAINVSAASIYVGKASAGSANGTSWANQFGIDTGTGISWGAVAAGDTVFIDGGSTSVTYTNRWVISQSGSVGNPISIKIGTDSGHNGIAIFEGGSGTLDECWWYHGQSYLLISGNNGTGSTNLVFQNVIDATLTTGFGINGGVSYVTIEYVTVTNCNNGIAMASGTGNEVRYSYLTHIRGDVGIDVDGSTDVGYDGNLIHHNTIESNTATNFSGVGPDGIQGTSSISSYNNVFRCLPNGDNVGAQHPDGHQLTKDYIKVFNNTFENYTDSGVDLDCWGNNRQRNNVRVYNNVFKITDSLFRSGARTPIGVRLYLPGNTITNISNVIIANNLFVDYPSRVLFWEQVNADCTFSGNLIVNNIVLNSGLGNTSGSKLFNIGDTTLNNLTTNNVLLDFNLIYKGSNGTNSFDRSTVKVTPSDWSGSMQGHGVNADPLFTTYTQDSTGNIFTLQSGSPARGVGINLSAYFTTDLSGNTRSAWDIGPYEYQSGVTPTTGSGRLKSWLPQKFGKPISKP